MKPTYMIDADKAKKILERVIPMIEHDIIELHETVKEYESDTFSASASQLTEDEVIDITASLISSSIRALIDCDTLDGIRLTSELEYIREQ